MLYTIDELAKISGVTSRTLRYYDTIGLLKPAGYTVSGYRQYGKNEVDLLQQILFFKALGFSLKQIKEALYAENFNYLTALTKQKALLLKKRQELDKILTAVENSLHYHQGGIEMSDEEKFQAFKKEQVEKNEKSYGQEIREKYGKETVEKSYQKFLNLTKEELQTMEALQADLFQQLKVVVETKDVTSAAGKKAYEDHRDWLSYTWPNYSFAAHKGLVDMYLVDERFKAYYEKQGEGFTKALHDVVYYYAN